MNVEGILPERVKNQAFKKEFECPICTCLLWKPIRCKNCEKHFCESCLKLVFEKINPNNCPYGGKFEATKPVPLLLSLLGELQISCINEANGCKESIPYESLEKHQEKCQYKYFSCQDCQKNILFKELISHSKICKKEEREKINASDFDKKLEIIEKTFNLELKIMKKDIESNKLIQDQMRKKIQLLRTKNWIAGKQTINKKGDWTIKCSRKSFYVKRCSRRR